MNPLKPLRARQWELPVSSDDAQPQWAPASVKWGVKTAHQLEAKVSYHSGPQTRDQQVYSVSMFVFVPEQLAAVSDDLYNHLTQDVRLHTPKVSLTSLREADGPLDAVEAQLQKLLKGDADVLPAKELAPIVRSVIQGLRLYACVFRSSLRRAGKQLQSELKDCSMQGMDIVSKGVAALVFDVCRVLKRFDQVGKTFSLPQLPEELQEEFALVDEFLLFEADRALMKLLRRLDKRLSGSEESQRPSLAGGAADLLQVPERPDSATMKRSLSELARSARALALAQHAGPQPPPPRTLQPADGKEQGQQHIPALKPGSLAAPQQLQQPLAAKPSGSSQVHLGGCGSQQLQQARHTLGSAIIALEDARSAQGYWDSIIKENDEHQNEMFTYRLKLLKRNVRQAVRLAPKTERPSMWFADLVGASVAAAAMAVACATIVFAQVATKGTRYTLVFSIILIVGYVVKDRMKEWGKRYLEPFGSSLGVRFPDRIRKLYDYTGRVVGRCEEKADVVGPGKVPQLVRDARHADKGPLRSRHPAIQPERVIRYKKEIRVHWGKLGKQLQHTSPQEGLDDIMVLDLSYLCQRMQPPLEQHHKLWSTAEGQFGVEKTACARTYHINVVLRVKSLARGADDRTMVMQRVRVVMDRVKGIKRLETDESMEIHMHKPVPLRPAVNRVERLSVAALQGLRHKGGPNGGSASSSGDSGGSSGGSSRPREAAVKQQEPGGK